MQVNKRLNKGVIRRIYSIACAMLFAVMAVSVILPQAPPAQAAAAEEPTTYTVTYTFYGETLDTVTVPAGAEHVIANYPLPDVLDAPCTLTGWSRVRPGTFMETMSIGETLAIERDETFIARYTNLPRITVTCHDQTIANYACVDGYTVPTVRKCSDPSHDGKYFLYWIVTNQGYRKTTDAGILAAPYPDSGNLQLKPVWDIGYTVKWSCDHANPEVILQMMTVIPGDRIGQPDERLLHNCNNASHNGKILTGWRLGGTETVYPLGTDFTTLPVPDFDLSFIAVFGNTVALDFDVKDSSGLNVVLDSVRKAAGAEITAADVPDISEFIKNNEGYEWQYTDGSPVAFPFELTKSMTIKAVKTPKRLLISNNINEKVYTVEYGQPDPNDPGKPFLRFDQGPLGTTCMVEFKHHKQELFGLGERYALKARNNNPEDMRDSIQTDCEVLASYSNEIAFRLPLKAHGHVKFMFTATPQITVTDSMTDETQTIAMDVSSSGIYFTSIHVKRIIGGRYVRSVYGAWQDDTTIVTDLPYTVSKEDYALSELTLNINLPPETVETDFTVHFERKAAPQLVSSVVGNDETFYAQLVYEFNTAYYTVSVEALTNLLSALAYEPGKHWELDGFSTTGGTVTAEKDGYYYVRIGDTPYAESFTFVAKTKLVDDPKEMDFLDDWQKNPFWTLVKLPSYITDAIAGLVEKIPWGVGEALSKFITPLMAVFKIVLYVLYAVGAVYVLSWIVRGVVVLVKLIGSLFGKH